MKKRILSIFIAISMMISLLSSGGAAPPQEVEPPEPGQETEISVRLMARDNIGWQKHDMWASEPVTITRDTIKTYTLKIENMNTTRIVSLALMSAEANFCEGCDERDDCAFNAAPELPVSMYYDDIRFHSVVANNKIPLTDEPFDAYLLGEDWPFYTGYYPNAELWNGWYEPNQHLTNITFVQNTGTNGDSFALPGTPRPFINSIEVTFSVVAYDYCDVCHRWVCICCGDCGECPRCLFIPCCDVCCWGFEECEGDCGTWQYCCPGCNPCGECCVCLECPGCERCFERCCWYCCEGFGKCEGACKSCCYCIRSCEDGCCRCVGYALCDGCCDCDWRNPCDGCCWCIEIVFCDDCNYCNLCYTCHDVPCTCERCADCDEYPCECAPTFSLDLTGGNIGWKMFQVTNERDRKSINPDLIKGMRFTFDIPDFECDGEHLYTYTYYDEEDNEIYEEEELPGCMLMQWYSSSDWGSEFLCCLDENTYTVTFSRPIDYLALGAYSIFEGNDGTVLIEVLGEDGGVLKRGQKPPVKPKLCSECGKVSCECCVNCNKKVCVCLEDPNPCDKCGKEPCECPPKSCDCCKSRPNAAKRGHVLGGKEIQIFDALEILKYLVGISGQIDKCENAFTASLIVSKDKPGIFDTLEILKYLIGMNNEIG